MKFTEHTVQDLTQLTTHRGPLFGWDIQQPKGQSLICHTNQFVSCVLGYLSLEYIHIIFVRNHFYDH